MAEIDGALCRVVNIEWDRGHESLDAIVRAETSTGFVITEIDDLCPLPGLSWIRANEIVSVHDHKNTAPCVRIADLRNTRTDRVHDSFAVLSTLLEHVASKGYLVGAYRERTGSNEMSVGEIATLREEHFRLELVDPQGQWRTCEPIDTDFTLAEVIRIDWGTNYLTALAEISNTPATEPRSL